LLELEHAVKYDAVRFGMDMVHKGSLCLARFADSLARVEILEPSGLSALCFLIDSGEKMVISLKNLTVLPNRTRRLLAPQVLNLELLNNQQSLLCFGLHDLRQFACGDERLIATISNHISNVEYGAIRSLQDDVEDLILFKNKNLEGTPENIILLESIFNSILIPNLPEVCITRYLFLENILIFLFEGVRGERSCTVQYDQGFDHSRTTSTESSSLGAF
jgi:hypothetical protein